MLLLANATPIMTEIRIEGPTTELRKLIGTLLRERLTPYLERQDQRVVAASSALAAVGATLDADQRRTLESRLDKLQTWQSRARTILPVIGKML